jgi:hypothetical protein
MERSALCRTFGAYLESMAFPGLTAGPIQFRPFGPEIRAERYMASFEITWALFSVQYRNPELTDCEMIPCIHGWEGCLS